MYFTDRINTTITQFKTFDQHLADVLFMSNDLHHHVSIKQGLFKKKKTDHCIIYGILNVRLRYNLVFCKQNQDNTVQRSVLVVVQKSHGRVYSSSPLTVLL